MSLFLTRKVLPLLTALTVCGLAASGCGDSVSKAEFIKEADAICKTDQAKVKELEGKLDEVAADPSKLVDTLDSLQTTLTGMYDGIDKLDKPDEDSKQLDEYLKQARAALKLIDPLKEQAALLQKGVEESDPEKIQKAGEALQKSQDAITKASQGVGSLANKYGFKECDVKGLS